MFPSPRAPLIACRRRRLGLPLPSAGRVTARWSIHGRWSNRAPRSLDEHENSSRGLLTDRQHTHRSRWSASIAPLYRRYGSGPEDGHHSLWLLTRTGVGAGVRRADRSRCRRCGSAAFAAPDREGVEPHSGGGAISVGRAYSAGGGSSGASAPPRRRTSQIFGAFLTTL